MLCDAVAMGTMAGVVTVVTSGCRFCTGVVFGCVAVVSALVWVTTAASRSVVRSLVGVVVMKAAVGIETVGAVGTISAVAVVDGATLDPAEGGDVIGVALVGGMVILDSALLVVTVETEENQVSDTI